MTTIKSINSMKDIVDAALAQQDSAEVDENTDASQFRNLKSV